MLFTSHNLERYVEEALESIRRQTFHDFELVIVDDDSRDATADTIQRWLDRTRFPAVFIRNTTRRGQCGSLNDQLAIARGQFVCFLDHDDVYECDYIERQVACLIRQPEEVAAVYCDARIIGADGELVHPSFLAYHLGEEARPTGPDMFQRLLLRGNFLPASGVTVRRQAIDSVGWYDESLFYQDYQMWLKLANRFRFEPVEGCGLRYRLLPGSASRSPANTRALLDSDSRILRSWLGRCGTLQDALVDRIWDLGIRQLDRALYDDARQTFAAVGLAKPKAELRMALALLALPGMSPTVSAVRRAYQWARRSAGSAARLTNGSPRTWLHSFRLTRTNSK